jgi:hypothetical protein
MYNFRPEFLTEMYGYDAAAAHLGLPHQLLDSLTIEQISSQTEGWSLVDQPIHARDYCMDITQLPQSTLPFAIHACQPSGVGPWYFIKYFVPHEMWSSCDHALFAIPNALELDKYIYAFVPWSPYTLFDLWNATIHHRTAFLYCQTMLHLNQVAMYFKQQHCGPTANYRQEYMIPWKMSLYESELVRLNTSGIRASFWT